jgi:hypothetical protein
MKRFLFCICLVAPVTWGQNERELLRKAVRDFIDHQTRLADFSFVQKSFSKEFTSDGKLKNESQSVRERKKFGEFHLTVPVERNGKPLTDTERAETQKSIDKILAELKALSPAELERRKQQRLENARKADPWVQEMPEAINLKLLGEEKVNGRAASIFEATPNPAYKAKNMQARVFEKMRGKIWLDKADTQLVRADIEVFDTVSIGFGVLGRLEKGTRFFINRVKASADTWLTAEQMMKIAGRMMLVKPLYRESSMQWTFKPE